MSLRYAVAVVALAFPLAAQANATVQSTGLSYPTIGEAITFAGYGDVITIDAGTYAEDLSIVGKDLEFVGAGVGTTVIQGAGASEAVRVLLANVVLPSPEAPVTTASPLRCLIARSTRMRARRRPELSKKKRGSGSF